jgi:hypothetical protein
MKTIVPEAVVIVAYKGKSSSGIRGTTAQSSETGDGGDKGVISGSVKVDASELDIPERGDTVEVGGKTAFVSQVQFDAVQALMKIDYTLCKDVSEEGV